MNRNKISSGRKKTIKITPCHVVANFVILNSGYFLPDFFEGEFVGIGVDFDSVAVGEFAGWQFPAQYLDQEFTIRTQKIAHLYDNLLILLPYKV